MKKKFFTSVFMIVTLMVTSSLSAQISNYFNTAADITDWEGAQCDIAIVDGKLQVSVTGAFWAVASYTPSGGLDWDFDNNKVVCFRLEKKFGDVEFKFYDGVNNYVIPGKNDDAIRIDGTDALIYYFELDALELTGVKHFNNIQIANTYVSPGNVLNFDWIKSFKDLDEAFEFIGLILEGKDPTTTSIKPANANVVNITGGRNVISFTGMTGEDIAYIYDLTGKCIHRSTVFNNDITGLNAGIYLVKTGNTIVKIAVFN
jgi:hypothetical protein